MALPLQSASSPCLKSSCYNNQKSLTAAAELVYRDHCLPYQLILAYCSFAFPPLISLLSLVNKYKIFMTRLSFHSPFVEHLAQGILKLVKHLRYYGHNNYPQPNRHTHNDNEVILELGPSLILVSVQKEVFPFIWKKLPGLQTQQHSLGSHAFSGVFSWALTISAMVLLFPFLSQLTAELVQCLDIFPCLNKEAPDINQQWEKDECWIPLFPSFPFLFFLLSCLVNFYCYLL